MPRKKPNAKQSSQRIKQDDAILVLEPPPSPQRDTRRVTVRMNAFIREYEVQCGNISAACSNTGVSRRTYYRWMHGTLPLYLRFQKKLLRILPRERLKDAAESVILHHLNQKDLTAAIFTAKTIARDRGWSDKEVFVVDNGLLDRVAKAFTNWLADNPTVDLETKLVWLERFAQGAEVAPMDLAKRVGMNMNRLGESQNTGERAASKG